MTTRRGAFSIASYGGINKVVSGPAGILTIALVVATGFGLLFPLLPKSAFRLQEPISRLEAPRPGIGSKFQNLGRR